MSSPHAPAAERDGEPGDLALVMGGGGARAAYQVGVLRGLASLAPKIRIPILTGVSAGAINTGFLASHTDDFDRRVERLSDLWQSLTTDTVFRSDAYAMIKTLLMWGTRLVGGGGKLTTPTRGMVDTSPLREFLEVAFAAENGALVGVRENLARGWLKAVGITTTDYTTGQSITFVQGRELSTWDRPMRRGILTELTVAHVLASASLPLFFPAVQIGEQWHGDGGVRLTAPLSPALHLGAERILAISTRYQKSSVEADRPTTVGYPPPAQVLGILFNAIFLDMLDYDAMSLDRLNQLLREVPEEKRMGLRTTDLLIIRPSQDLSLLASRYEPRLPQPFKFLTRSLGTRETKSPDSLSMVMFEEEYIRHAMQLGEEDARRRGSEIAAFVEGKKLPSIQQTGFWRI